MGTHTRVPKCTQQLLCRLYVWRSVWMMASSWWLWWRSSVLRLADTCSLPLGPSAQLLMPHGSCGPICSHWLLLEVLGGIISSSFVADVITVFFVMWSLFLFFCGGRCLGKAQVLFLYPESATVPRAKVDNNSEFIFQWPLFQNLDTLSSVSAALRWYMK